MLLRPTKLLRLVRINWVLVRYGLDDMLLAAPLLRPVSWARFLLPWHWWRSARRRAPRGERLRLALEELGPVFVKLGQALSTRRDLLPDDIADELAKLQDRVPPFPGRQAQQIVELAYGAGVDQIFLQFDPSPLASASIAQVHVARLLDGTEVVVKVVRPEIEKTIRRDLDLMRLIAQLSERYLRDLRRLKPVAVVDEYEKTIFDELDLVREAANASQLRRNFDGSELLYVPEVYWDYSRRNVLVMERIRGVPIGDLAELRRLGVNLKKLSERGVEIFFTQVLRDSFFHADMHPGNIFVDVSDPSSPSYIAVDFGIIGTLNPTDQHYLAENFIAFFYRDYRRVAELHIESGWVPPGTRVDEFESAIRTVSEPIFDKPLKDISFSAFLLTLFQLARRFNMEVQPQLVLLQKTLLNIEGLGRQLDPDLDLWQTAKPLLQGWMSDRVGPRALLERLRKDAPRWLEQLPQLPGRVNGALRRLDSGEIKVQLSEQALGELRAEIRAASRRTFFAVIAAALLVGAATVLALDGRAPLLIAEIPLASWLLGALAALALMGGRPREK